MLRRVVFAAVVLATGAGLVGQASGQQVVTAGAFCSPAGATGVTSTGIPMTCTTAAGDGQNRWRATSEVTSTTAGAVTTTVASTTSTTAQAVSQAGQTSTTVAGTGATTTIPQSVAATPSAGGILALTG